MIYKNKDIVIRHIEPAYFMVDIKKCYNNTTEKMFSTDEVGVAIWNVIQDGDSIDLVVNKFLELLKDEKTDELIRRVKLDTIEYIEKLKSEGIILEI